MRIAAKYLYTLTSREPLSNGYVEFDADGTIVSVGLCEDPSSEANFIDGAICPGFVNAHCHVELSHLWNKFERGTGMTGFINQINALRDTSSREEKIADIQKRMDEMWADGVSAMADISNCDDSFAIKAASPIYTRTFLEVFGTEPADCDNVMSSVLELSKTAARYGLDAAPTPHACYTMSPELLRAASAEGLKSGYLSYHSEESMEEDMMIRSGEGPMYENRKAAGMSTPPVTGTSSLEYFVNNLLQVASAPVGGNVLLVHEVCMDSAGMDLAQSIFAHPFVALCPKSNIFIHNALPPVMEMREHGMKITVGTDSLSSNDSLDMVGEMFCLQDNFPELTLGEILTWVCRNGAELLGKQSVMGTIEAGKQPGLVAVTGLDVDGRLTAESQSKRIV